MIEKLFTKKSKMGMRAEIDDAVLTLSEKAAGEIEWPISRRTGQLLWALVVVTLIVLGGRLFYLNFIRGEQYEEMARRNSLRAIVIPAPRGIFYDRFGKALVENVPSVDALIMPNDLPQEDEERRATLDRIRQALSLEDTAWTELTELIALRKPFPVKKNLSQEEIILLINRAKEMPGLQLFKTGRRQYLDGPVFAHILGYEGKIKREELSEYPDYLLTDSLGKQGIEKSYEESLRGVHGAERVEVDALGQIKRTLGIVSPVPGNDVLLHIDAELQKKIHTVLSGWLETRGLKSAAAIALDPRDGAVLSLVSLPGFDNNLFARGISQEEYTRLIEDPSKPLFNRAIAGTYPPGSTIKPVYAAAALSENLIRPETSIESKGGITVGNSFFGDWKAHGFTDLRRAIAVSSDVYFYSIGGGYGSIRGLGIERLKRYANLFGFGEKSGIDLPGEAAGTFPDKAWKENRIGERWYIGDDYNSSIGQGFILATPLQIANATASIANGGTLYQPRLVASIRTGDGKLTQNSAKVLRRDFIKEDILKVVREGMRATITEGTAMSLRDLSVAVAGKTGTAQYGSEEKTHGWFVSFAPYEDPRLVLLILVEGQGEEGYNAVPITKEVLSWYFSRPEERL